MKVSAVCTITKSLPIKFFTIVSYSLLANFGYINLFIKKKLLTSFAMQNLNASREKAMKIIITND